MDTISYFGPKIWNLLPDYIKEMQNLATFEKEIKSWVAEKLSVQIMPTLCSWNMIFKYYLATVLYHVVGTFIIFFLFLYIYLLYLFIHFINL